MLGSAGNNDGCLIAGIIGFHAQRLWQQRFSWDSLRLSDAGLHLQLQQFLTLSLESDGCSRLNVHCHGARWPLSVTVSNLGFFTFRFAYLSLR